MSACRPGPLQYLEDYKNNAPCKLTIAQDIAAETRGVLLYHDQCALALQRLAGCTPEEAEIFRRDNSGIRRGKSRELLLQRIAAHQYVSQVAASDICSSWNSYARYSGQRKIFQKKAFRTYLRAAEKIIQI